MLKNKVRSKSPSLSAALLVGIIAALSQQYDEIMRRPKKKSIRSDPFKRFDF